MNISGDKLPVASTPPHPPANIKTHTTAIAMNHCFTLNFTGALYGTKRQWQIAFVHTTKAEPRISGS